MLSSSTMAHSSSSTIELVLLLFTVCNGIRIFAYIPQIITLIRDPSGAESSSCATWMLFTVANVSTILYAIHVARDGQMALLFAVNTACCAVIVALIVRARVQAPRRPTLMDEARRAGLLG